MPLRKGLLSIAMWPPNVSSRFRRGRRRLQTKRATVEPSRVTSPLVHARVFAGQQVGIREIEEKISLVGFMHYDLGFFDYETGRVE
jgi:hypothetical protein